MEFIGKKALEKIKKEKIKSRFAMFTLKESKPGEPLLLHDEPIYLDDNIIGKTTSGNYSFNLFFFQVLEFRNVFCLMKAKFQKS